MKKMECTEKQVVIFDEQVRFLYIAIPITTQRFPTVRNGWLLNVTRQRLYGKS